MVKGHSYCNYEIWNNDGKFNSIGREDETNLMLLTKQVNINYESLEQCYDESLYNNSGIKCDNVCQTNNLWCKSVVTSSCVIGDSHVSWGLYFNIYIILWHILDQMPSMLTEVFEFSLFVMYFDLRYGSMTKICFSTCCLTLSMNCSNRNSA